MDAYHRRIVQALILAAVLATCFWAPIIGQCAEYIDQFDLDGTQVIFHARVAGAEVTRAPVLLARRRIWDEQSLRAAFGDEAKVNIDEEDGTIELISAGAFEVSAFPDGAIRFQSAHFYSETLSALDEFTGGEAGPVDGLDAEQAYAQASGLLSKLGIEAGTPLTVLPFHQETYSEQKVRKKPKQKGGSEPAKVIAATGDDEGYLMQIEIMQGGLPYMAGVYFSEILIDVVRGSSAVVFVSRRGVEYLSIDGDATCYETLSVAEAEAPLLTFEQARDAFLAKYSELYLDYPITISEVVLEYLPKPDAKSPSQYTLMPVWGFYPQAESIEGQYMDPTYIDAVTGLEAL